MSRLNVHFEPATPQIRALLEERARQLASAIKEDQARRTDEVLCVSFELGGTRCALEASVVQRALVRLGRVAVVPTGEGAARPVAFVDGRPLPVADLASHVRGRARGAEALNRSPGLVVGARASPVALAVDGPLELCSQPVAQQVDAALAGAQDGPQLAGRLEDGTLLLSAQWLLGWADGRVRAG